MSNSDKMINFIKDSKGFVKNPLGIIALFISLIYGFACLVLGISGNNLDKNERFILIIFLVSFPLFILVSFLFLVTKHFRKLYSPSDFKDEKNYLVTIDINSQKSRIQNQVIESKIQVEPTYSSFRSNNQTDIFQNYLVAENLILRILEKDYNLPLRRNVKFEGHASSFDCIIEGKDIFIGAEIKYYYNIENKDIEPISLHLRRRFHTFQRIARKYYSEKKRKFIIYIVHDNNIDSFKNALSKLLENENNLELELRFYEYEFILKKFVLDK